jgi:hypothetical protein
VRLSYVDVNGHGNENDNGHDNGDVNGNSEGDGGGESVERARALQ